MSDFTEFDPPQLGELVFFERALRDRFVPALRGVLFRFRKVQSSPDFAGDEWVFYDELFDMNIRCSEPDRAAVFMRRATLSEKDAHFRRLDPATQQLNENLKSVFSSRKQQRSRLS